MTELVQLPAIRRGERWVRSIKATLADMDWTGVTVSCVLRARDGRQIADLASYTTLSIDGDDLLCVFEVPGSITAGWLGTLYGDVRYQRTSPAWGPYDPVRFAFEVRR